MRLLYWEMTPMVHFHLDGIPRIQKTSPSKRFNIHLTDMYFSQYLEYQNVGIKPEHYLNVNSDWIKQTLSIISNYK